jgi:hypothetical protein
VESPKIVQVLVRAELLEWAARCERKDLDLGPGVVVVPPRGVRVGVLRSLVVMPAYGACGMSWGRRPYGARAEEEGEAMDA